VEAGDRRVRTGGLTGGNSDVDVVDRVGAVEDGDVDGADDDGVEGDAGAVVGGVVEVDGGGVAPTGVPWWPGSARLT
jgi:hypothetical protein